MVKCRELQKINTNDYDVNVCSDLVVSINRECSTCDAWTARCLGI